MLLPTDRVVAKVLTKMLGQMGAVLIETGVEKKDVGRILGAIKADNVGDNPALSAAIKEIRMEVIAEGCAENEGRAVPNVTPFPTDAPQPWNE